MAESPAMDGTDPEQPTRRDSARIVLLDGDGRVLLLSIDDARGDLPAFWITPGGGIEPGESIGEAALRELEEETGMTTTIAALGDPVAVATGAWTYRSTRMVGWDWFFVHVAVDTEVRTDGWTELEREVHRGWRWWTSDELRATDELVVPGGLASLVERLHAGWRPSDGPELLAWVRV
jgi:8-oxo-dGTP pyrophosphatase MutT (NUDIX family)